MKKHLISFWTELVSKNSYVGPKFLNDAQEF